MAAGALLAEVAAGALLAEVAAGALLAEVAAGALLAEVAAGSGALLAEGAAGSGALPALGAGVPLLVSAPLGLGAGVPGAVVPGFVVLGAVALTELLLPEEVPVGDAVPATGFGRAGGRTERAGGDAPDRSLVDEAEAGCAGADADGVGPVHGLDVTYKLWVAGLPEPDPVAGAVAVGVGMAEPVGAGVGGAVVGVMLGAVVGAVVGVTEGTGATMPGVVVFGLGTVLVGFTHVDVGEGLAVYFPVPRGPVGTPATPGSGGWPVPLLLAPPVPPPGPVPPDEDEAMLPIAFRKPGTAKAVPANRQTAAKATTSRSPTVPTRWYVARSPETAPAPKCRSPAGTPLAAGASGAAVTRVAGVVLNRPDGTCQPRRARLKSHARASAATYRSR